MIGYLKTIQLDDRVRFWNQFLQFVQYAENTFRYMNSTTSEMIHSFNRTQWEFAPAIRCGQHCKEGLHFPDAWEQAISELQHLRQLPQGAESLLREFGMQLGTTDLEGQLSLCALYRTLGNEQRCTAADEKKKKARLYVMLGAASGLGLNLLLL